MCVACQALRMGTGTCFVTLQDLSVQQPGEVALHLRILHLLTVAVQVPQDLKDCQRLLQRLSLHVLRLQGRVTSYPQDSLQSTLADGLSPKSVSLVLLLRAPLHHPDSASVATQYIACQEAISDHSLCSISSRDHLAHSFWPIAVTAQCLCRRFLSSRQTPAAVGALCVLSICPAIPSRQRRSASLEAQSAAHLRQARLVAAAAPGLGGASGRPQTGRSPG